MLASIEEIEEAARRDELTERIRKALATLARHGYTASDLDFLQFEGQGGMPGDDDPELEEAIGVLGHLREAGFAVG